MTKVDIELKKRAARFAGIATQLMSLMKDFDQEFRAFRKDAETKWPEKKNQMDYVVKELLTPANDILIDNGENLCSLLSDAAEVCRIESGYGPSANPVEDVFEMAEDRAVRKQAELDQRLKTGLQVAASKKQITADLFNEDAAKESAKKQAELDRRRQAGLEFAASKKKIVPDLFSDSAEHTKKQQLLEQQGEANRKAADSIRENSEFRLM